MKVLAVAYYEFIKNLRDIKMLGFLVIFPVITTIILGTAVEGYFSGDSAKRISIVYINKDKGVTGREFDKFLENEEIIKRLHIKKLNDKAEGDKVLKAGEVDVMIYLPEDLSQSLQRENRKSIELYGKENMEYVESIINSFTGSYNAINALISVGGAPSGDTSNLSNIKRVVYTKDSIMPRAIDYYAVLVLLQMLVIGAIFGVFITAKNYGSDIHIRTHSLPINPWNLIAGKILGSVLYLVLAAFVNILGTKLLYNVNWNGNSLVIFGVIFIFCIIVVGIGVLIGLSIANFSFGILIVFLLMIFFGTFSGSISPAYVNDSISIFIPNHHAKILIFGAIYGYSKAVMVKSVLWLLGMIAVIYGTAVMFIRRYKHDNI